MFVGEGKKKRETVSSVSVKKSNAAETKGNESSFMVDKGNTSRSTYDSRLGSRHDFKFVLKARKELRKAEGLDCETRE
jgi:hypothetical protein